MHGYNASKCLFNKRMCIPYVYIWDLFPKNLLVLYQVHLPMSMPTVTVTGSRKAEN